MSFLKSFKDFFTGFRERPDLEPCPFCGGKELRYSKVDCNSYVSAGIAISVECRCGGSGPSHFKDNHESDMDWNGDETPRSRRFIYSKIYRRFDLIRQCPFCEVDNEEDVNVTIESASPSRFYLMCGGCAATGPYAKTKEQAIKLWNNDKDS